MKNYDHIIVVGVDGAGAFFKQADTPNFDKIFAGGAVTYSALASNPTISAECWGSMLLGTSAKVHGLTNEIVEMKPYPQDSEFPSLFRRIREKYPNDELGAICHWTPIISGIIESGTADFTYSEDDPIIHPVILEYILSKKPNFLFIQYDNVDFNGHYYGYGSKVHLNQISGIDQKIGQIYDAVEKAGILDSTLFMVIADHGGDYNGENQFANHGGWTDAEKYVTFAALGKTVNKGVQIEKMNIRDLSSIILHAYGIDTPEFEIGGWTSQIPSGLFNDAPSEYRDISEEEDAAPRISRVQHTSEPAQK